MGRMVRQANKLSPLKVKRLKEPGVYCDGLGLWLSVSQWGTKAWIFRYTRHGRRRHMGLGALHTVSLAEARERARRARQILLDGDDPLEIARKKRDETKAETAERILFLRMLPNASSISTRTHGRMRSIKSSGEIRLRTTPFT